MTSLEKLLSAFTISLASIGLQAQQSQVPVPAPAQAQVAPAPCASAPVGNGNATAPVATPKISDSAKKAIEEKRKWLQKHSPFQLPDLTSLPQKAKPALPPCPPIQPNTQLAPVLKMPTDVSVTLRCNPLLMPKGSAPNSPGFILPDPRQYGTPEPNQVEADTATPDVNAKTPCYAVRADPKTNKVFVAQ